LGPSGPVSSVSQSPLVLAAAAGLLGEPCGLGLEWTAPLSSPPKKSSDAPAELELVAAAMAADPAAAAAAAASLCAASASWWGLRWMCRWRLLADLIAVPQTRQIQLTKVQPPQATPTTSSELEGRCCVTALGS